MGNVSDQRRKNVIKIIQDRFEGSKTKFAARVGQELTYISKVTTDKRSSASRNLSDLKAREWEAKVGVPDGWLDKPHGECVAYVLLSVQHQKTREVLEYLKTIPEIKKATAVSGSHDIIIKVVADNQGHLGRIVADEFKNEFITKTVTYPPVEVEWGHWERE